MLDLPVQLRWTCAVSEFKAAGEKQHTRTARACGLLDGSLRKAAEGYLPSEELPLLLRSAAILRKKTDALPHKKICALRGRTNAQTVCRYDSST